LIYPVFGFFHKDLGSSYYHNESHMYFHQGCKIGKSVLITSSLI